MGVRVVARPGDELKVEKEVKESLTLPNMKISAGGSQYILNPSHDKAEHDVLTQESVDILVSITSVTYKFLKCT